jgi:ankyrin repeat protein
MERLRRYISRNENQKFKNYIESHPEKVDEIGFGLLKWATLHQNVEIMRYLLEEKRVRPYSRIPEADEPLEIATRSGNKDIVDLLLAHGANFAMIQNAPLRNALTHARSFNPPFIRYILDIMVTSGPYKEHRRTGELPFTFLPSDKINPGKLNYLHLVARNVRMAATPEENKEILQILMDAGVGFDEENAAGETPLVTAAISNNMDFIQAAIALGVDVSKLFKMAREGEFRPEVNEAIQEMLTHRFGNVRLLMQQPVGNLGMRLPNNIATEIAKYNTGLRLRFPGMEARSRRGRRQRKNDTRRRRR